MNSVRRYLADQLPVIALLVLTALALAFTGHAHAHDLGLLGLGVGGYTQMRIRDMPNIPAGGGTTVLQTGQLDGLSLHALHFLLNAGGGGSNLTRALITRLMVKVGEVTVVDGLSATQLQSMNQYKGCNNGDANRVSFYFGNPDAVSERDKHYTDLDLSLYKGTDGKSFAPLEIQMDTGAAVAPNVWVVAEVGVPKMKQGFTQAGAYFTRRYFKSIMNLAGANAAPGQDQPINIGARQAAVINREFWFNAQLTTLEVRKNNTTLQFPATAAQLGSIQLDKGHPTVAGCFVVDPCYEGHYDQSWTTDGAWQHLLVNAAADVMPIFVEAGVPNLYQNP